MILSSPPLGLRAGRMAVAELNRAANPVPAPATPYASWGRTFRTVVPNGSQTGRIPDGWNPDGIKWQPFCCRPATVNQFNCCEESEETDAGEADTRPCAQCCASPFDIDLDELKVECPPCDTEQFLRDNIELSTDLALAAAAHEMIRQGAENASPNMVPVTPCKAAGAIAASRGGMTVLWLPEEYAHCTISSGLGSWVDGEVVDVNGQPIMNVPGVPNLGPTGPDGEPIPAPEGCFWMAGTSPFMDWAVSEVDYRECADRILRLGNTAISSVRRQGIVRADKCDVVFALATLPDGCAKPDSEVTP